MRVAELADFDHLCEEDWVNDGHLGVHAEDPLDMFDLIGLALVILHPLTKAHGSLKLYRADQSDTVWVFEQAKFLVSIVDVSYQVAVRSRMEILIVEQHVYYARQMVIFVAQRGEQGLHELRVV